MNWLRRLLSRLAPIGALFIGDGGLRNREFYGDHSGSGVVATTDSTTVRLVTCKTNHTIYLQRVHVDVTTGAAKTWTVQDTTGTPVPIAKFDTTNAGPQDRDFGDDGYALAAGKHLDLAFSASGAAGTYSFNAYQKLTTVGAA